MTPINPTGWRARTVLALAVLSGCHPWTPNPTVRAYATDRQLFTEATSNPDRVIHQAVTASATRDIPCPIDGVRLVARGSADSDTHTGVPVIVEGCGRRLTYSETCERLDTRAWQQLTCDYLLIARVAIQ